MSTDALYVGCMDETMKLYSKAGGPTYMYLLDYRAENSMVDLLLGNEPPLFKTGVCHGDDLFHLFHLKIDGLRPPSFLDIKISQRMLTLWSDFARFG